MSINITKLVELAHSNAVAKGFHTVDPRASDHRRAVLTVGLEVMEACDLIEQIRKQPMTHVRRRGIAEDLPGGAQLHLLVALTLIATEVSEAMEAAMESDLDHCMEELADVLIRVGDVAGWIKANHELLDAPAPPSLEAAVLVKIEVNKDRPYLHGKHV